MRTWQKEESYRRKSCTWGLLKATQEIAAGSWRNLMDCCNRWQSYLFEKKSLKPWRQDKIFQQLSPLGHQCQDCLTRFVPLWL